MPGDIMSFNPRIDATRLTDFATAVYAGAGMPEADARLARPRPAHVRLEAACAQTFGQPRPVVLDLDAHDAARGDGPHDDASIGPVAHVLDGVAHQVRHDRRQHRRRHRRD
jgi:hypothetical protein